MEWQENFNQSGSILYELCTCLFIRWRVQQSCQTIRAIIPNVLVGVSVAKKYRASVDQPRGRPGHHREQELRE